MATGFLSFISGEVLPVVVVVIRVVVTTVVEVVIGVVVICEVLPTIPKSGVSYS